MRCVKYFNLSTILEIIYVINMVDIGINNFMRLSEFKRYCRYTYEVKICCISTMNVAFLSMKSLLQLYGNVCVFFHYILMKTTWCCGERYSLSLIYHFCGYLYVPSHNFGRLFYHHIWLYIYNNHQCLWFSVYFTCSDNKRRYNLPQVRYLNRISK